MTATVFCVHDGHLCILPGRQVIDREPQGNRLVLHLWDTTSSMPPADTDTEQGLLVHASMGVAWLPCVAMRLERLIRTRTHALPPVVTDSLGLPHVVGLTSVQEGMAWLIDLRRYRAASSPEARTRPSASAPAAPSP